jgi:hypothetical protein
MHPIERLRYVARAGAAPDLVLVAEAVPALAAFARDKGALLVAVRQLIVRQPDSPGLVVLGARMLTALEPVAAAWAFVDELENDRSGSDTTATPTDAYVEDVVTVASGPTQLLVPPGAIRRIERAREANRTVVAITPSGTRLPRLLWKGFLARSTRHEPYAATNELVDADLVDQFAGSGQAGVGWSSDCSDVAELSSF